MQNARCMIKKWPAEHGRELHPNYLLPKHICLLLTLGPNISDFFDLCLHALIEYYQNSSSLNLNIRRYVYSKGWLR